MKTTDTCPKCSRPVNPDGCRDERLGWYCIIYGLQMDTTRIVAPRVLPYNPDPIGEAEQAVIDQYAPQIAEAQAVLDGAQQLWEAARERQHKATVEAGTAGVSGRLLNVTVLDPHNRLDVRRTHERAGKQRKLADAQQAATQQLEAAERALDTARNRLSRLQQRQEHAQRVARTPIAA